MNTKIIASALLALVTTFSISSLSAEERRGGPGGPGGKPPAEAFEACASKAEGDSCSVSISNEEMTGSCRTPPRGEEALVCAPERGSRPPRGANGE